MSRKKTASAVTAYEVSERVPRQALVRPYQRDRLAPLVRPLRIYADVVEEAIRQSRGSFARGFILTDLAREFGYARSRVGRAAALRSGVDVEGAAAFDSDVVPTGTEGPTRYDALLEPHALGSVLVSAVCRGVHHHREVRYAIYKRLDSERRRARQHAAMRGRLKAFWERSGRRFLLRDNVLHRLHGGEESRTG